MNKSRTEPDPGADLNIRLRVSPDADFVETTVARGSTLAELAAARQPCLPYRVLAAKVDHQIRELNKTIDAPADITLLDMRENAVSLMYRRSLALLYLKAVDDLFGRTEVTIGNSLNKGLYTVVKRRPPLTPADVRAVEDRMREITAADTPFVKESATREEALEIAKRDGHREKARLLETGEVDRVVFYALDGFRAYFYGQMVPSAGFLEHFELRKYHNGVLLRFPQPANPGEIPPYLDHKKLYEAFGEAVQWGKLTGVSVAADLNERVTGDRCTEMIQLSEALHEKRIALIADRIAAEKKRMILIAGPSSSGKTTFARRLCIQLRVNGLDPLYLGMDDYFVERHETPRDALGKPNYEDPEALDQKLFNDNMNALLRGETADLPRYDFRDGHKFFGERLTRIKPGCPIVIEGIHGLNGRLTAGVDDREKFKIYISPLTALNIDPQNHVPTSDVRLLRRIIRDNRTRGNDARRTIATWPSVRAGENRNIFPFNGEADVLFNSAHIYEIAVLKKYAMPLLDEIGEDERDVFSEAYRLRRFLQFFKTMDDDSAIVNNSILREFIGGSIFTV